MILLVHYWNNVNKECFGDDTSTAPPPNIFIYRTGLSMMIVHRLYLTFEFIKIDVSVTRNEKSYLGTVYTVGMGKERSRSPSGRFNSCRKTRD